MELIYLFAILAVLGITGIIYAAVEFHRQNRRPAKIPANHLIGRDLILASQQKDDRAVCSERQGVSGS